MPFSAPIRVLVADTISTICKHICFLVSLSVASFVLRDGVAGPMPNLPPLSGLVTGCSSKRLTGGVGSLRQAFFLICVKPAKYIMQHKVSEPV